MKNSLFLQDFITVFIFHVTMVQKPRISCYLVNGVGVEKETLLRKYCISNEPIQAQTARKIIYFRCSYILRRKGCGYILRHKEYSVGFTHWAIGQRLDLLGRLKEENSSYHILYLFFSFIRKEVLYQLDYYQPVPIRMTHWLQGVAQV